MASGGERVGFSILSEELRSLTYEKPYKDMGTLVKVPLVWQDIDD